MTGIQKLIRVMPLPLLVVAISIMCIGLVNADASRAIQKDYPVTTLTDRVYVVYGPLGEPTRENQGFRTNCAFVVTDAGVVVMDPGTSVYVGNMLLKKIRTVTDKPVVAVFNTHVHGDHWLGNQTFKEANPEVNIYGHAIMKKQAEEGEGARWIRLFNEATDNAVLGTRPVPPDKTVKDGDEIKLGGLTFRIHHTGAAHTDGDIMIEVVEEQVLYTGDIVRVGLVGITNASFKGNIIAIDRALATNAKIFIPGHGQAGDQRIAEDYRKFLSTLRGTVAKYYDEGLSDFEIKPKVVHAMAQYKDWKLFDANIGRLTSLGYLEVEADAF